MKLSSILTALDSSPEAQAGLNAAAELAGRAGAKLNTIYIEDENWFQATRTSIVRHISRHTGESIDVDEQEITRQSQALKTRLEQQVTQISREWKIEYNCRTSRGKIDEELIRASEDADLVVIGRRGTSFHTRDELGSTAKYLTDYCTTPVLMWSVYKTWPPVLFGIASDQDSRSKVGEWVSGLNTLLQKDARLVTVGSQQRASTPELPGQSVERTEDIYQWSGRGLIVINRQDALFSEVDLHHYLVSMYNPVLLL